MKTINVTSATFMSAASLLSASLFTEVTGLSSSAQSSLVAHYDGRIGLDTTGSVVNSWTPVDGNGVLISSMTATSTASGAGAPELINYNGSSSLIFTDSTGSGDGRYLTGSLSNSASSDFTVIWLGHYKNGAPFATSGTYAYNIGPNNISHQRDDFGDGFRVELYNGTTYGGDDITALDGVDTVWSTVLTADSHTAYANGINLNVAGAPTNNVVANATINIGAFNASGYDLVGEISHILVFDTSLSNADRLLIEDWLAQQARPPAISISVQNKIAELTWTGAGHLLSSDDLKEWRVEAGATSPMTWTIDKNREFFRLAKQFTEVPKGAVFRTQVTSYTWRDLEYDLDSGDLYLCGEQTHGLDLYDAGGNDFWWCYMNSGSAGSGLLEFLMDNNLNAAAMKATATSGGWAGYTAANYSFLTFQPLASHKTYINTDAPSSPGGQETTRAYTDDYTEIPSDGLLFTVYRNSNSGIAYFGLGGPSLASVVSSRPPGDGTAEHDNGVRYDIALKVNIPLSDEKKLELLNKFKPVTPLYDDTYQPYYLVHPPGL